MAGMGMDMGIGQGAALAGSVMSSVGDMQSARALARAKRRQRAEQQVFMDQDHADEGARITNDNQWLMDERNTAKAALQGQQYLESVRGRAPVGLSVSQRVASAPQADINMAELQAANHRLAQAAGQENTQTGLRLSAGEFADRRAGREADAARAASMYDTEDMQAAAQGDAMRAGGGLLQVAGGAVGGGMFSGIGGSANGNDNDAYFNGLTRWRKAPVAQNRGPTGRQSSK